MEKKEKGAEEIIIQRAESSKVECFFTFSVSLDGMGAI
jgi:hypothetical protein